MKIKRTKELIQVGYYLSRFGLEDPPVKLNTDKWNEAYRLFYDSLNDGRSVLERCGAHSLPRPGAGGSPRRDEYDEPRAAF